MADNTSLHSSSLPSAQTDDDPVLRVRGPADLINVVPYLIGFHPVESLVVVGLAEGRVVVTIRMDLDNLADPAPLHEAVASMRRGGAESFLGMVFTLRPPAYGFPHWEAVAELDSAVATVSAPLQDVLLVGPERFWSYLCTDPTCCPPDGTERDHGDSGVAAAATYAGLVALPDRESLYRLLDPLPDEQRGALRPALEAAVEEEITAIAQAAQQRRNRSVVRALFAAARAADAGTLPNDPAQLARFGAALRGIEVRDALWMGIDDGRLDGEALWRHLARTLPSPFDAAPLFLLGWGSWRSGSGALAGIAAERALESDPSYTAAELLLGAVSGAVDPRSVPKLRRPARRCDR
ncbi:DUF4192 domain-containing protein [Jatrophihabitans sp.]|uniref:DUF4192 domain-containing protein n=1 Tax=Jatrophihabitans sp. TaxID=1932789 RepID=UPI0030C6CF86|nr:hypothetical protein [Jatrophihabitans sp.]